MHSVHGDPYSTAARADRIAILTPCERLRVKIHALVAVPNLEFSRILKGCQPLAPGAQQPGEPETLQKTTTSKRSQPGSPARRSCIPCMTVGRAPRFPQCFKRDASGQPFALNRRNLTTLSEIAKMTFIRLFSGFCQAAVMSSKCKATCQRWASVLFVATVCAIALYAVLIWANPYSLQAIEFLNGPLSKQVILSLLLEGIGGLVLWWIFYYADFSLSQFRKSLDYPHTLFVVWGAFLGTVACEHLLRPLFGPLFFSYFNFLESTISFAILFGMPLGVLLLKAFLSHFFDYYEAILSHFAFFKRLFKKNKHSVTDNLKKSEEDSKRAEEEKVIESILEWIRIEEPIELDEDDYFGRKNFADRIASRLVDSDDGTKAIKSIGLVGPYGSGKSSIVNLVKKKLETHRDPEIWFCTVSCWGFSDSQATLEFILSKAVKTIGERMDCLPLKRLPQNYRAALSKLGSWADVILSLFGDDDPEKQLQRIAPLLDAANAKLILVIEDLDRSQTKDFDVGQVLGTLQRIKSLKNVSFILSGHPDSAGAKIDFTKLSDHIETLVGVNRGQTWAIVKKFRDPCLLQVPQETLLMDPRRRAFLSEMGMEDLSPSDSLQAAISEMLESPRTLKHVLRHTADAWQRLKGECDFDDLLAINALRYGSQAALDFVLENRDLLQGEVGGLKGVGIDAKDRKKIIFDSWNNLITSKNREHSKLDWDSDAAFTVICFLFPVIRNYHGMLIAEANKQSSSEPQTNGEGGQAVPRSPRYLRELPPSPQGVWRKEPTDYLQRILEENVFQEMSDQRIVQRMRDWKNTPSDELPLEILENETLSAKINQFASFVPGEQYLALAEQVVLLCREKIGNASSKNCVENMIATFSELAIPAQDFSQQIFNWFRKVIPALVVLDLEWGLSIYNRHFGDRPGMGVGGILYRQSNREIETAIADACKRAFKANPKALLDAIFNEDEALIYQLIRAIQGNDMEYKTNVRWLGVALLAAAKADLRRIFVQLKGPIGGFFEGTSRVEIINLLFNESQQRKIIQRFAQLPRNQEWGSIPDQAATWLKDHPKVVPARKTKTVKRSTPKSPKKSGSPKKSPKIPPASAKPFGFNREILK